MSKTCIIAEHDPWQVRLLRLYGERLGLRLIEAFDGRDLLRLARSEEPDVIILESNLPGSLQAGDILRSLKADCATRDIPVVWLSWLSEEAALESVPGVASCLQKPATYEAFLAALAEAGACG